MSDPEEIRVLIILTAEEGRGKGLLPIRVKSRFDPLSHTAQQGKKMKVPVASGNSGGVILYGGSPLCSA